MATSFRSWVVAALDREEVRSSLTAELLLTGDGV
jgi:hypothetical protein